MRVDAFDFDLPHDRIAQRPAAPRDAARLLRVAAHGVADHAIRDLPALLAPGDLLVTNDTRVLPARLVGRRGGTRVEATLHKEEAAGTWRAFARPARKLTPGDRIDIAPGFAARVTAKGEGGEVTLALEAAGGDPAAALRRHGRMPLPPYIKRPDGADDADARDYQSPFAREDGAVAAPTASLHFTPELLAALEARGVGRTALTLHVGAGTFLPVKAEDTAGHRMHGERYVLPRAAVAAVAAARARGGRVVAVGTTALRALEAVAAANDGRLVPTEGETELFITPGFRFRVADLLLTNFHLPRSTLFMLVAAFAGLERTQAAYAHAIRAGYRFFSYGDACLLERPAG